MTVVQERKLRDWVSGFLEYTDSRPTSKIFMRWAAISTISAVLSRKVWAFTMDSNIYPNLYVFLVGEPASGKTVAIYDSLHFAREIEGFHVAPSSMTAAALSDTLKESETTIVRHNMIPPVVSFHSLYIASEELQVLLPQYDLDIMARLTQLWDGNTYDERRRGKNLHIKIDRPTLTLFAGTTPSFLTQLLPPGAWDQGFISRVIMVYSNERIIKPLFQTALNGSAVLHDSLIADLKSIYDLYGKVDWSPDAVNLISSWHLSGGEPAPEHIRLVHYTRRRTANLIKLCCIASASRSNSLKIEAQDFQTAMDWLTEAEAFMPDIFTSMASGGDGQIIDEAWHYIWDLYQKENRPITEPRLYAYLKNRTPFHNIQRSVEVMLRANMIRFGESIAGTHTFIPISKQNQHEIGITDKS